MISSSSINYPCTIHYSDKLYTSSLSWKWSQTKILGNKNGHNLWLKRHLKFFPSNDIFKPLVYSYCIHSLRNPFETSWTLFETLKASILTTLSPAVFQREAWFKQYHLLTENMPPKNVNKLDIYLGGNGSFKRSLLEAIIVSNNTKCANLVNWATSKLAAAVASQISLRGLFECAGNVKLFFWHKV